MIPRVEAIFNHYTQGWLGESEAAEATNSLLFVSVIGA